MIPTLKQGKTSSSEASYRPISLLPAISKVVEKVLSHQLVEFAEERGLLPTQQRGFRQGHSVETALATVLSETEVLWGHLSHLIKKNYNTCMFRQILCYLNSTIINVGVGV